MSKRFSYIYKNIKSIFIGIYIIYYVLVTRNLIVLTNDVIPSIAFVVFFFFSYTVFRPVKLYWYLTGALFIYILAIFTFDLVPTKKAIILLNYYFIILILNYVRHLSLLNLTDKFRFANEIVNKGNSITIAGNKKGEISFCSDTITTILGYTPEELIGRSTYKMVHHEDLFKDRKSVV